MYEKLVKISIVTNINTTNKNLKNSSTTKTEERLYGNC